jgi:nitrogen fixation protein NifQ
LIRQEHIMGGSWPLGFVPGADLLERRLRRDDEVDDVRALLLDFADPALGSAEDLASVAEAVALACLGDNHLWQDLQLDSRVELSALLHRWFPALAARNTQHMKWKKFFYKQLCERAEIHACRAPSCAVCTDYAQCFGAEDGEPLSALAQFANRLPPQAG